MYHRRELFTNYQGDIEYGYPLQPVQTSLWASLLIAYLLLS